MKWQLTDDDGYAAFVRDEDKNIICCVQTSTDELKARAKILAVAPEAVALLSLLVTDERNRYIKAFRVATRDQRDAEAVEPIPFPTHPNWFAEAVRVLELAGEL